MSWICAHTPCERSPAGLHITARQHVPIITYTFHPGNLCYNEATPVAISREGAIPLLVNLIDAGTDIAREEAVRTLGT
jgi:hypothetical protein